MSYEDKVATQVSYSKEAIQGYSFKQANQWMLIKSKTKHYYYSLITNAVL